MLVPEACTHITEPIAGSADILMPVAVLTLKLVQEPLLT